MVKQFIVDQNTGKYIAQICAKKDCINIFFASDQYDTEEEAEWAMNAFLDDVYWSQGNRSHKDDIM
jgi:hypothetical protein